jgi:hypothetical protein
MDFEGYSVNVRVWEVDDEIKELIENSEMEATEIEDDPVFEYCLPIINEGTFSVDGEEVEDVSSIIIACSENGEPLNKKNFKHLLKFYEDEDFKTEFAIEDKKINYDDLDIDIIVNRKILFDYEEDKNYVMNVSYEKGDYYIEDEDLVYYDTLVPITIEIEETGEEVAVGFIKTVSEDEIEIVDFDYELDSSYTTSSEDTVLYF